MPERPSTYRWQREPGRAESLQDLLTDIVQLESANSNSRTLEIFDSFNQCLRKAKLCLIREGDTFSVGPNADLSQHVSATTTSSPKNALFWQDFETGELQDTLKKNLKLRSAATKCTLTIESQQLAARNQDGKIIARLTEDQISTAHGDTTLSLLSIQPLRGYESETRPIAEALSSKSDLLSSAPSYIAWAMETGEYAAPPPTPQQAIQLKPEQSVQAAVEEISRFMITVARGYEAGICEDIDSEFLHDYRVSIRKLRSVLSLIKGAYPKEETRKLKTSLGNLARKTNRLRDLDVYLMEADNLRAMLPEYLQAGLDRMFADFRKERIKELRTVSRHLKSKTYDKGVTTLLSFFSKESPPQGERSHLPIGEIAAAEIRRHYNRVAKSGAALEDSTPDEQVHELRIECKKLRYLLELFSSLFPPKEIKTITRQLKGLQNTLGLFNDYCVQQESLAEYLETAAGIDSKTSAALGGLITHLHKSQIEVRSQVSEKFLQFNDADMKQRFKRVFPKLRKVEA